MLGSTIAAIATPPGSGGIGIIRISGQNALNILQKIFRPKAANCAYTPRHLYLGVAIDPTDSAKNQAGENTNQNTNIIDQVMAVYMPAPHSYTGEDTAEIHCHGGYIVCREILTATLAAGAVPAEPGEFTSRAFINGKLSLDQAESVIDIIEAKSSAALKISARQLSGSLDKSIAATADSLLDLLARLEVAVDYPEETDEAALAAAATQSVTAALADVRRLLEQSQSGRYYRDGVLTAIIGPPNAGKSTLLNALLERERSIVTPIAGTTRDTVEEYYLLNGLPLKLVDTAGIRETDDPVERFGVERSRQALQDADLILLLLDPTQPLDPFWSDIIHENINRPLLIILNKSDLISTPDSDPNSDPNSDPIYTQLTTLYPTLPPIHISAKTGTGLDSLRHAVWDKLLLGTSTEPLSGLINDRQKSALLAAETALLAAAQNLDIFFDAGLLSIDIQTSWQSLAEITGQTAADDIIDRVFQRFCLGK